MRAHSSKDLECPTNDLRLGLQPLETLGLVGRGDLKATSAAGRRQLGGTRIMTASPTGRNWKPADEKAQLAKSLKAWRPKFSP